jgi:hypothetical protein
MATATKETTSTKLVITLAGLADMMFDPFFGQEKDTRPPEQKWYLNSDNVVCLPAENLWSFLFRGGKPVGCALAFQGKQGGEYQRIGQAHMVISPSGLIPFSRNGKPIIFNDFDGKSCYVSEFAPCTKNGSLSVKQNIRKRPVLMLPWELTFNVLLFKNTKIDSTVIYNWFVQGGIQIGLGNYRPRFGRFQVKSMEEA